MIWDVLPHTISRRRLLEMSALGMGSVALGSMLKAEEDRLAYNDLKPRDGHFPAPAKAVIQFVQNGGPSQMDLFDPKPELTKWSGKPHPDGVEIHQPNNANVLLASPFQFSRHGQSGMELGETIPHIATVADDICLIRSMHTEHNNHSEGLHMLLTCHIFAGRPVLGSWVSYALGTENQNLPAFVVLRDPEGYSTLGKQLWTSGFLSALYQGVEFSSSGTPVRHLHPRVPPPPGAQRAELDTLAKLNRLHLGRHPGDSELEARIQNYELAARMQLAATDVLDVSKESEATKKLYGIDNPVSASYGQRCLMARRLIEAGVRFVQIHPGPGQPWDNHAKLREKLSAICAKTDQPVAGLLKDLKSRGLLESTILLWAGEFGRLPTTQNSDGRDHNRNAFTLWFAGGGFKPGLIFGETDDFGYKSVVDRVSVPDMIATVLHQLGLDHRKTQYPHGGRMETPADVTVTGARVVGDLLTNGVHVG
jgi:hypothetical protein